MILGSHSVNLVCMIVTIVCRPIRKLTGIFNLVPVLESQIGNGIIYFHKWNSLFSRFSLTYRLSSTVNCCVPKTLQTIYFLLVHCPVYYILGNSCSIYVCFCAGN